MRHGFTLAITTFALLTATSARAQVCVPDPTHLCFEDGRFTASAAYWPGVSAAAVQPAGGRPGYFHFGDPASAELWLTVANLCSTQESFLVAANSVSDAGLVLTVQDQVTGAQKSYSIAPGDFGAPIRDYSAFPCGGFAGEPAPENAAAPLLATTVDLAGGRFRVKADVGGGSTQGQALQLTRNSGLFTFLDSQNLKGLVKIYQGEPGFFGVAFALPLGATTLEVQDRCTGNARTYHLDSASSWGDPAAFPEDFETCGLFMDGFESGDVLSWSLASP